MDFNSDHFSLFELPVAFRLDASLLDRRYIEMQSRVHPDRFASAGEAERRLSLQWATRVNEAYQTLKAPGRRARYLLQLLGHDPRIDSNTAMPTEFLMKQMELRESVEDARSAADEAALDQVRVHLLGEIKSEYDRLAELIDASKDYSAAADLVRQLMFQEKLLNEIDDALEAVTA